MRAGICLKYLKGGWNRKDRSRNRILKKRSQAVSRAGCLKKGGLEPPHEQTS